MIWAYGTLVQTAWQALSELGDEAAEVTLINARFAKPFDAALLRELAPSHGLVLSLEDHALMGGFGSVVAESILDQGLALRLHRAGVRDELVSHAARERQLADQGLDRAGVVRTIRALLQQVDRSPIPFVRIG
jgi:1-deoxy-D-xylulose-5-phosphate synthase